MTEALRVLLFGQLAGRIERFAPNRMRLTYEEAWRHARSAVPISISMPLAAAVHQGRVVEAWLWGLLPDNAFILERWGRRYQVSPRNPLALLAHVGEDCPGAVQIVRPERLDTLRDAHAGDIKWLDDAGVAAELRRLDRDKSAWRAAGESGQFSLAGAQPKTALLFDGERWGIPSGRSPTTHILKPPVEGLDHHVENEHFCLSLARAVGLPAAASRVGHFEDRVAIIVERYDRLRLDRSNTDLPAFTRVHQEDMCQALGRYPWEKYQNEGGPGPEDIVLLLRRHSSRPDADIATFLDALVFNWLIAGTDAHAKNYALLLAGGGQVRLAPLYDIASSLPYDDIPVEKAKLAMKIGGKYRVNDIVWRHWRRLYEAVRVDADMYLERHMTLARKIAETAEMLAANMADQGLDQTFMSTLGCAIAKRAGKHS